METSRVRMLSPDVWERLNAASATGEQLAVREAIADVSTRLLAGVDSDGGHHLVIALLPGEPDFSDTQTRGLSVTTRLLTGTGTDPTRHLDIHCRDASGNQAFDMIGAEIAEQLDTSAGHATDSVRRILAKWRRFWGQSGLALSREAQIGLFGELWFLAVWLIPSVGISGVQRWRGPLGARHDFEWVGCSVESKCTASAVGRIHHINGIDQLAPPDQGRLLFFSLRVRDEGGASNSVPTLIDYLKSKFQVDSEAADHFDTLLIRAGYSSQFENEYRKLRLRIVDQALFEVSGEFPRLTSSHLAAGALNGIRHVSYEIDLTMLDNLAIARTPQDLATVLQPT